MDLVGKKDGNNVALLDGLFRRDGRESILDGLLVVGRAGQFGNDHVAAAILEVLGVAVSLGTVAQNGNGLVFEQGKVGVFVVVDSRGHGGLPSPSASGPDKRKPEINGRVENG